MLNIQEHNEKIKNLESTISKICLLYTSYAADEL